MAVTENLLPCHFSILYWALIFAFNLYFKCGCLHYGSCYGEEFNSENNSQDREENTKPLQPWKESIREHLMEVYKRISCRECQDKGTN